MFVEVTVKEDEKVYKMIIRKEDVLRVIEVDEEHCDLIYKPADMEETVTLPLKESIHNLRMKLCNLTLWGTLGGGGSIPPVYNPITASLNANGNDNIAYC